MNIFNALIQKSYRYICNHIFTSNAPLTIVTGANSTYFETLTDNLLASISEFEPGSRVVVWDLGLSEEEVNIIKKDFPKVTVNKFNFESYPEHYALSRQSYAWKSACIYETLKEMDDDCDMLFWLDAGCRLKGHLNCVRHIIKRYGFYSPYSSTTVAKLTWPKAINEFEIFKSCNGKKQMLNGATIGVRNSSKFGMRVIWEWYQLSKNKDFIVPEGSNRSNHRQDQSLLSLIYYSYINKVPMLANKVYDVLLHQKKEKIMVKTARQSNVELLRIISMFLIICHHFLLFGVVKTAHNDAFDYMTSFWLVNSFLFIGVNVFILISGYFGIKFKVRGLFRLYLISASYALISKMLLSQIGGGGAE